MSAVAKEPGRSSEPRDARPSTRVLAALGVEASGVAHDFDNALTAIVAHASLLRASHDGEARRRAEAILRACRVGAQVVQRVRRALHPEVLPPERVAVDLEALIGEAVAVAEVRAERRGIRLVREAEAVRVAGDPAELQQAFMNVVHNAIDAAREEVMVSVTVDDAGVRIDVRDDGEGVPEAMRTNIFEAFVSTRGEAGTGLGLTMARAIVRDHGGDLSLVTSGPTGSHFRFRLPALFAQTSLPAERPLTGFELPSVEASWSALVVDDDEDTRLALAELLSLSGAAATTASSPAEALSALAAPGASFDLVVTDLELGARERMGAEPGGALLVRRIGALDPTLPILVVSGASEDVHKKVARLVAATLRKPVSPARLVATARELALARRRLTDQGPP